MVDHLEGGELCDSCVEDDSTHASIPSWWNVDLVLQCVRLLWSTSDCVCITALLVVILSVSIHSMHSLKKFKLEIRQVMWC